MQAPNILRVVVVKSLTISYILGAPGQYIVYTLQYIPLLLIVIKGMNVHTEGGKVLV